MGANEKWIGDSSQHKVSLKTPRTPKTFIKGKKGQSQGKRVLRRKGIFPVKRREYGEATSCKMGNEERQERRWPRAT